MKAKSILVVAIALISSVAFGEGLNDGKLVVVNQNESGIFKVIYEGKEKVNVRMNIVDKDGNVVLTKSIKGVDGFILPVNFSGMEAGEYTIELVNGSSRLTQSVTYTSPSLKREASIQHVHVAPLAEGDKYLLSVVKTGNEAVIISIVDSEGNPVFTETHKTNGSFARVYNVKLFTGTPTFMVSDKNGSFNK